ncbi:hypothetical protein D1BOALGB6SA_8775 [Olavius sp. associated proteobacterium Delta 1]|nr:hypothetical protein D1BOALGB6SA_8775 [Olavius sp. associated proteobacterium Delta 1]
MIRADNIYVTIQPTYLLNIFCQPIRKNFQKTFDNQSRLMV